MKITHIAIGRTLNLGNFNSTKMEVTVEITEDENPAQASKLAKEFIMEQLALKGRDRFPEVGHPDGKGDLPQQARPRKRQVIEPDFQGDEPEAGDPAS